MQCTIVFLDEYPLPDSFERKAFMLTLVCLHHHIVLDLKPFTRELPFEKKLLETLFNY